MNSKKLSALFYDAEIVNCIQSKNEKKDNRFKYCGGWHDFAGMGIACICCYDAYLKTPRIFSKGNFGEFQKLVQERKHIIGYNSIAFDDKLMKANGMEVTTTYDIFVEIRKQCAKHHSIVYNDSFRGYGLGTICEDNRLPAKLEKGSNAPKLWQAGMIGQVMDYCLQDVMVLWKLYQKRKSINVGIVKGCIELPELSLEDY